MHMSWRSKLMVLLVIFAIVPAAIVALLAFDTFHRTSQMTTLEALQGLAKAKAEAIDQFTESRQADVQRIAGLLSDPMARLARARAEAAASTGAPPIPSDALPKLEDADELNPDSGGDPDTDPEDEPEDSSAFLPGSETGSGSEPTAGSKHAPAPGSEPAAGSKPASAPGSEPAAGSKPGSAPTAGSKPASKPASPSSPSPSEPASSTKAPPEEPASSLDPAQRRADAAVTEARSELQRMLGLLLGEQETFEELLLIAPDGRVMQSTFGAHEGKTAAEVEYFQRGRAATYVQPVFVSPITEQLTMVIATPIRDQDNEEFGVLAARLNLKRFFRVINDNTGLGESGETLVGKKIDDDVVFMAPTRHDVDAALERRFSVESGDAPMVKAARGDSGFGTSTDYRGQSVLAAWTYAPALDWGVVTKIDADEAYESLDEVQSRVWIITLVVIALAVLVSLACAHAMLEPLRDFKNATERISKGDLDVEFGIRSRDEFGDLADSFERMVAAIKFFREHSSREGEDSGAEPDEAQPVDDEQ